MTADPDDLSDYSIDWMLAPLTPDERRRLAAWEETAVPHPSATRDPDLDALLAAWAEAVRNVALRRSVGIDCERARAAIDAHLAERYVRREQIAEEAAADARWNALRGRE